MKKILVVSPHADDETLGAGGYLLKHRDLKDEIYWLNVTNARTEYGYTEKEQYDGVNQTQKVSERYGMKKFYDLCLEPAALDKYDKSFLINKFSEIIKEVTVYQPARHGSTLPNQYLSCNTDSITCTYLQNSRYIYKLYHHIIIKK